MSILTVLATILATAALALAVNFLLGLWLANIYEDNPAPAIKAASVALWTGWLALMVWFRAGLGPWRGSPAPLLLVLAILAAFSLWAAVSHDPAPVSDYEVHLDTPPAPEAADRRMGAPRPAGER